MSLRRPKNPGARRDLKRTPAQEAAWRIFRLRSLWHLAGLLSRDRADGVRTLIDDEIHALGAPPECFRQAVRESRWLDNKIEPEELPF